MLDTIGVMAIMLSAGILGAGVSTALSKEERTWEAFRWNCVIGIGASFLIPVFLTTVSSKALEAITDPKVPATPDKYFIFSGFCVLGAISARHLITTLSEKVLQVAKNAEKTAQEAKKEAQETRVSSEQIKKVALAANDAFHYGIKEQPMEISAQATIAHLDSTILKEALKSDDPWKGRFGSKSVNNGRKLLAEIAQLPERSDSATITFRVISTDSQRPLSGTVMFYIHPSFFNYSPVVPVAQGEAVLNITSWGAFTVGAVCDAGETQLELDLAEHPDAWEPWKSL